MAALRSRPGGDRQVGIGSWVVGLLATWAVPSVLGLGLAGVATLLGQAGVHREGWLLTLHATGWVLVFSPLLSWMGLVALAPLFWLMLRRGQAGWASTMAAGALAAALALVPLSAMGGAMAGVIVVPFGAAAALILRATLGWLAPAALAAEPAARP